MVWRRKHANKFRLTELNGLLYFSASIDNVFSPPVGGAVGRELWVHDPVGGTTTQVAAGFGDNPDNTEPASSPENRGNFLDSSDGKGPIAVNGKLYMSGFASSTQGFELYSYDSTAGMVAIQDMHSSTNTFTGKQENMFVQGNVLHFNCDADYIIDVGKEWHTYDTNTSTLGLVKDIRPGTGNAGFGFNPPTYNSISGKFYFPANDNSGAGTELWVSDGLQASVATQMVKDIKVGSSSGGVSSIANIGGSVVFEADDGTGDELWISNGTPAGTKVVKKINSTPSTSTGSDVQKCFAVSTTKVIFGANDGSTGIELHETDGTAFGTQINQIFYPETPGETLEATIQGSGVVGNKYVFGANNGINGREIWVSDGTAGGTQLLKDIRTTPTIVGESSPSEFVTMATQVLFAADDGVNGREPWRTDGTAAGTYMIVDLRPGVSGSGSPNSSFPDLDRDREYDNKWFFYGNDGTTGSNELHFTDGTLGNLTSVDIKVGSSGSNPRGFTQFKGKLWFNADDGVNGRELWTTDGVTTAMAFDLNAAGHGSEDYLGTGQSVTDGNAMVIYKGELYFVGDDGSTGYELWKTDGSLVGTSNVADMQPLTASQSSSAQSRIGQMAVMAGNLYFGATWEPSGTLGPNNDGQVGSNQTEPFCYDGVSVTFLGDLNPGIDPMFGDIFGSTPQFHRVVGGLPMFHANVGFSGAGAVGGEFMTTDGTAVGTVLAVGDNNAVLNDPNDPLSGTGTHLSFSSFDHHIQPGTRKLYYQGNDGTVAEREPWVTDGTIGGTNMIVDFNPSTTGTLGSFPGEQRMVRGDVMMNLREPILGEELYTYFPGASSFNVGVGCNKSNSQARVPVLTCEDPVLDGLTSVSVTLDTDAPLTPCVIVIGSAAIVPVHIGGGCHLYTGFNVFTELSSTDVSGKRVMFGGPLPVPANPALIGVTVACQGVVNSAPTAPLGLAFSNGQQVTGGL